MPKADLIVRAYEDLAHIYDRQGQPKLRDWFLVLAADAAFTAGLETEAERLRVQLLSYNPHHLLKPFVSFVEALHSPDIQSYIADLRRTYPPEAAEQLLETHRPGGYGASPAEETPSSREAGQGGSTYHGNTPGEEPQIYRLANGATESRPASPPARTTASPRPPAPAPRTAHSTPAPPARPARPPLRQPSPLLQEWNSRPQPLNVPEDQPSAAAGTVGAPAGAWVATVLFGLVFLAGLAVTVYTLAQPFVPPEWLSR